MSEFELITITYSFVLGLGIAQILGATSAALRNRHRRPLHWLPFGFAASIFFFHIQYWFVLFDYDTNVIAEWTWLTYGPFLALAVILFLAGGVVLPSPGDGEGETLLDDFERNGKLSLVFLAAYILAWVPANAWGAGDWFESSVWFNIALTVPLAIAYLTKHGRLRTAAAIVFLLAQAFGLLFIWSTPADVSG